MKLVLYSGGYRSDNTAIDQELLKLISKKTPKITYIPSSSYDYEEDYIDFCNQYKKFKINQIINFPIDNPVDMVMEKYAFESDVIHLSGGNTFYFLHHLRKRGYLRKLKDYIRNGGVITGLSAGGILMTPNINTASFPEFDRDDNALDIKNLNSLNIVNFEFFPHYINSKRYDNALRDYSKTNNRPIYACSDGAGIIVNGLMKSFYGKVFCFFAGQRAII